MIDDTYSTVVIQWCDPSGLKPHPDADLIPQMKPDRFDELVEDIEKRGIIDPLVVTEVNVVLDGRHRLMAARAIGLETVPVREFEGDASEQRDFMLRAALLRRHLTSAQRKELAAKLIIAEPERSDRSVAKATGISRPTVAMVRDDLEAHDQVADSATSIGADGKAYPRPTMVREEPDTSEAGIPTDYDDLFAHAEDPKVRYRLGEKLHAEEVNGHHPRGRLKAISEQYGATVPELKEHVTFWQAAFSCFGVLHEEAETTAASFALDSWVIDGDGTVAELIPAIPAQERKVLRAELHKSRRCIERLIEALK